MGLRLYRQYSNSEDFDASLVGKHVLNVQTLDDIKSAIARRFPKFRGRRVPIHVFRGRRVPIHIQADVENELQRLIDKGHIKNLDSCSEQFYISPIVITVKRYKSQKLALDSKLLNRTTLKNKCQMQNIECPVDSLSQEITNNTVEGQICFRTIDLKYAYCQIPLHPDTAKRCNFNLVSGEATGTYRFLTGLYGLNRYASRISESTRFSFSWPIKHLVFPRPYNNHLKRFTIRTS